ncbi:ankyrin repeat and SOCS box protein 9 isoform X2 [Perognathus longimembris pacificus]|uniref:ankyrin repeat and SOCS box protein 9 isoform X2 n=1 Tax=Perognathus longimembris pacificus TaxID=214514 RepID=UPI002019DC0D|nr:ankyrin repeat and SOCS box protein 9 isoform X2 [Perognathus longimembris pacificus]
MDDQQGARSGGRTLRLGSTSDTILFTSPLMGGNNSLHPFHTDVVSDWSPMHDAAIHGRLLSLRNLLSQGWPVNLITADQVSPLHEACLGGHASCVNLLLSHGARVNGTTVDWHTPLYNACVNGNRECVDLLLRHGASPHPVNDVASPMHEAAKRGHLECIESLITYGGDIDHNINHLGTPLYQACKHQQIACAKRLLQSGANVNLGRGLDSPLHVVARVSNEKMTSMLMDFGADMQAKDIEGKRPADLVPPESPVTQIFMEREGPPSLMQLCRLRIRKCFCSHQHYKIATLFLPEELKEYLLHI